jgi:hypothetical protein
MRRCSAGPEEDDGGQGFVGYTSGCELAQEKHKNMAVIWERWRRL